MAVGFSPHLALVLGACLLASCAKPPERADLVFLNGAEPETIDPALITGQPEGRIASSLFEGLTAFDQKGAPGPGVADRWEISPDGRTYRFHFREAARWSNGERVTPEDFVAAWRRTLEPKTASEYAYQLHYLKNAKAFNEGTLKDFAQVGVRAVDDENMEVTLENPTPFFLDLCAFTTLLPVHVPTVERYGEDWLKPEHIVTNGAYVLTEWRVNDRLRLRKNPYYWDREHVAMKTIDVLPIHDANTALNFYVSGEADLMMDKGLTPTGLLGELRQRKDFHSSPFLGNFFLRFNVTRPPFDDVRVRKALSLVVDRDRLVNKITRAGEVPAYSLVPPGTAGYEPPEGLGMNVAEARRLLAEAGFPGGKGFPLVHFLYNSSDLNQSIAVELQDMWQQSLGVNISPGRQEWKVYLGSLSSLDFDIARSSWVGDYNDPNTFMDLFVTDGGNNRTGWADPKYDALIAEAARTVDPARRFAIFRTAEELLIREAAPICPLFFYVGIQFYDPDRLGGLQANLLDEHPLRTMYWKK